MAVFKTAIVGDPNPDKVCKSYIERADLTVHTHCKRPARLILGFSKKLPNFKAAIALHLAYYNFVKLMGQSVARQQWPLASNRVTGLADLI